MCHERCWDEERNLGDCRDPGIDTQQQSEPADNLDRSGSKHKQRHKSLWGPLIGELFCREALRDDAKTIGEEYQSQQDTSRDQDLSWTLLIETPWVDRHRELGKDESRICS